jgi:cytochrome P450
MSTRSIADLPGPRRLPLVGNMHSLRRPDRFVFKVEEWARRYGPVFRFDLGPRRNVVLGDPADINAVMRDRPEGFTRGGDLETVFREAGTAGVFSAEGDDWRRARRLVVTALNSNHLQRYFGVVRTAGERLQARLERDARGGEPLEIARTLTSYSLDIISALAFGHDLNTLERGENELQRHIERHLRILNRRALTPVPYWRWLRLPSDRAWERSLAELHRAVAGFIAEARERLEARPELREEPENFLESMLAAQQKEGRFTDKEIVGNTLTLLIAGEDTTAYTMAWTTWLLARRPDIQARWAEEASEVLGEARFVTDYEKVGELAYGEAVLRESMRLKPVAPFTGFRPIDEVTIGGVRIPAGTQVIVLLRHAGLYESGVERALEFDPERWLGDDEGAAPDQKSFLAFGAGPRFCPGRNLAFLEAKAGMATIARNFEFELDQSGGPVTEKQNFAMVPENLRVRLRPRSGIAIPSEAGTPPAAPSR